ncbi:MULTISPECIES: YwmB family TATA-box binding protein [unclassified Virgibacillus]|uniref:YwmB family TATA-box binding protein n=1 Tax=unclassified Virgibacillus TaxID=2620237 RepID=UPI0024DE4F2F|nr:YwmB family TATA-box binding protein [Virgibacillus sp. LDC-1]
MRKVIIISVLIYLLSNNVFASSIKKDELVQLASIITSEGDLIETWEITIKENAERSRIEQLLEDWKHKDSVLREEDENSIKYASRDIHKTSGIIVSYNAVLPKNKQYRASFSIVIKGSGWDPPTQSEYQKIKQQVTEQYFTEKREIFTCLTTKPNAIMDIGYLSDNLAKKLKLRHVSTQTDNLVKTMHKKIIYGYTPLWEERLIIHNKPMNVQIVTEIDKQGDVTFTIGTPILINEY